MKLKNKVALITGGTSGIGLETAKLFRAEGASVIVLGSNAERLAAAGKEIGGDVLLLSADLRKPADIERAIEAARASFGRIDVVFANAGAGKVAPLEAVTPELIDEHFSLNFTGLFLTVQKAVPFMQNGGSVVVTTSFLDTVGMPGLSLLAATKAAVRSLVRTLGAELAPRGIRVNAVSPGAITTPFYGKLGLTDEQLAATAAAIQARVPLQRFGESIEIARSAVFLASDDSSYTTGVELVVDGGLTQF
ncbi:SDR family oxidoreductase [Paraburkholderia sp. USG1]|uniref:SDR family oxidoreductase n=1 Tax=Paraburkholderia sp. USG1 TaxID=2952268 RepID=UPI00285A341B|nr:SDR family oxidoreductase [Paraburkholderia sp. USG1]MDR8398586.1 SDR family oxidoreductase [Paraburkholderia sp. USG1]